MKITKLLFLICSFAMMTGTSQINEKRNISSFTKIQASGAATIVYENGPATVLIVEANDTEIKNIETIVKNNTLYIKTKGNFKHPFKVKIINTKLDALELSGASRFTSAQEIQAESFSIKASGASSIEMPLNAKKVTSVMEGASSIKLRGTTNEFTAGLSGASDLKASDFKSNNTIITASGASSAKVYASEKISTSSSGASHIKFEGNPKEILKKETSLSK